MLYLCASPESVRKRECLPTQLSLHLTSVICHIYDGIYLFNVVLGVQALALVRWKGWYTLQVVPPDSRRDISEDNTCEAQQSVDIMAQLGKAAYSRIDLHAARWVISRLKVQVVASCQMYPE